jgi:hypothetical protein
MWEETGLLTGYGPGEGERRNFITPSTSLLGPDGPYMTLPTRRIGTSYSGTIPQKPVRTPLPTRNTQMSSIPKPSIFDRVTDTDDFGNPLDANFAGDTNFGLLRDRAVGVDNYDAYNSLGKYSKGSYVPPGATSVGTPFEGLTGDAFKNQLKTSMYSHTGDKDAVVTTDPYHQQMTSPFTGNVADQFTKDGKVIKGKDVAAAAANLKEEDSSIYGSDMNLSTGDIINMGVEDAYKVPVIGKFYEFVNPSSDLGKVFMTVTDPVLRNEMLQFAKENPKGLLLTGATAYFANKSKPVQALWKKTLGRWRSSYPINNPAGIKKMQIAADAAKLYYGTKAGAAVLDPNTGVVSEPFVQSLMSDGVKDSLGITDTTTETATTDKTKTDSVVATDTPTTSDGKGLLTDKNTPKNKDAIQAGQQRLLSDTKKPGFWSTPIEGGAGGWDNKLFRLGEMMAYMGTPLSKRGDSPAKRWTSASNEASKLQAAMAKAGKKKGGIVSKLSPSDVGADIMTRLKKKPWFSLGGVDVGSQYSDDELTDFENLGKTKFAYWYDKTDDYEVAMKEALRELELGL